MTTTVLLDGIQHHGDSAMHHLDDLFNPNKVHLQLAEMLPAGKVDVAHVDRFSLTLADGIVTQVLATTGRFASDPEVIAYLKVTPDDESIWNPHDSARLGSAVASAATEAGIDSFGAVWIRGRDVHPNCRHNDVVGAAVLIGSTLFLRATTSAVKRAIRRPDGPDENAYTSLLNQLVRHYDPDLLRFDEDTTRATRDDLSSGVLADTCIGRGTLVQFGAGQQWDPQDPLQQQMLKQLLGFGAMDDVARRRKLSGKRTLKLASGGAPKAERQLPHGFVHARDDDGERIRVDGKGYIPEAEWDFVTSLQELVRLHADGVAYVDLGRRMAELGVERRGQRQKGVATFAELVADGDFPTLGEAAKSFFINSSASPTTELDMYLQKVRLWRTGEFRTKVENEIRGRGITVAGLTPIYRSDEDEYGYFDISVTWPWPVNPQSGVALVGWGIAEDLARCEARLVAEIGKPRPTGGAAHRRPDKRAVSPREWKKDGRIFSVQPRQLTSGRRVSVIFSNTERTRQGRRGWSIERANPSKHADASYALTELCGSLADSIERSVLEVLDPNTVAPATVHVHPGKPSKDQAREHRIKDLLAKIEANRTKEAELETDAEGQDLLAGRRLLEGDDEGADRAEALATQKRSEATELAAARAKLETQLAKARKAKDSTPEPDTADVTLNVAAYLVAGLRRARMSNGMADAQFAELVHNNVTDWHMTPSKGTVRWTARLRLPLLDGRVATIELSGVVQNVRSVAGGRAATNADVLAEQVLFEDRTLEDLARSSGVKTSRYALLTTHLMPWLKRHGVTTRAACCALVDHPIADVRQLLFGHLTDRGSVPAQSWSPLLQELITGTYTDANLRWGDAACPDDTLTIQRIVDALSAAGSSGLFIDDLAGACGWRAKSVRELAHPYDRNGFSRPRYVELHPDDSGRLRALACTHCRRDGGSTADRVVMLPEVAKSGFAVLCRCGRVPVPRVSRDWARWNRLAFPAVYTTTLFTRTARSSLRLEAQTGPAQEVRALPLSERAA